MWLGDKTEKEPVIEPKRLVVMLHSISRCAVLALYCGGLLFSLPLSAAEPEPEKRFDPTDLYEPQEIEGWRVLVNKNFLAEDGALCQETLTLLRHQLFQIPRKVPAEAVTKLRKVTIWVEAAEPHHPCMAYHPDVGWLREHNMNPDKARCVELANAKSFLSWTKSQPWMVLHELAHAYHHQFLGGFENAEIAEAFRAAKEAKRYDAVRRINGKTERAYAVTNPMEYFAEASEAFFGTNDFYPFVSIELKEHDPKFYELLEKLWGGVRER